MLLLDDAAGRGHRLLAAAISTPIDDACSVGDSTQQRAVDAAADARELKAAADRKDKKAVGGGTAAAAAAQPAEAVAPAAAPYAGVDVRLCDFDDVLYRVCVGVGHRDGHGVDPVTRTALDFGAPNAAHTLRVHMSAPFLAAAAGFGALSALRDKYGAMLAPQPAPGSDVTVCVDLRTLRGAAPATKDALILSIAQLKCTAIGGVFNRFFHALAAAASGPSGGGDVKGADPKAGSAAATTALIAGAAGGGGVIKPFAFPIRSDTTVWFVPEQLPSGVGGAASKGEPKVHVTFSVTFRDRVDRAVALTFLKEFVECEQMANVLLKGGHKSGSRPKFAFTKLPPMQVADAFGLHGANVPKGVLGYASFTVVPEHVSTADKRTKLATHLQGFRTFLQYHVKCSKALFHAQMRARATHMLVGVKAAKQLPAPGTVQARTASGRYFTRRDGGGGGVSAAAAGATVIAAA